MKASKMEFIKKISKTIDFNNEIDIIVNNSPFNINVHNISNTEKQIINFSHEEDIIKNIIFKVSDNKIELSSKGNLNIQEEVYLDIYLHQSPKTISVAGSGDINLDDVSSEDASSLSISGSGDILVSNLSSDNDVNIDIEGSGDVIVESGIANYINCKINGSGDILVSNFNAHIGKFSVKGSGDIKNKLLVTSKAKVKISGSGDIVVTVLDELSYDLKGSGDIFIFGNPEILKGSRKGSGCFEII